MEEDVKDIVDEIRFRQVGWCFAALAMLLVLAVSLYFMPGQAQLEAARRKVGEQQVEIQHLKNQNARLRSETERAKDIKEILEQVKEFFQGS